MSVITAIAFAKSRPVALRGNRDVDNYFSILESILRQMQDQIGTTTGQLNLGPIIEQAYVSGYVAGSSGQDLLVLTSSASFTTYLSCLVITTATQTITLNPYPEDGEKVTVQKFFSGGSVTISGTINDQSSMILISKNDCIDLVYSVDLARWTIV